MRMWNVPPKIMCRQHLLGEHVEMHMFASSILKNKLLYGYIDKNLLDPAFIKIRHYELAKEMINRNYKHNSPLDTSYLNTRNYHNLLTYFHFDYPRNRIIEHNNLVELSSRCDKCKALQERYKYEYIS